MPGRILIVDDEQAICSMLTRTFRAGGLESEFTTNPEDGLERLKDRAFDLVISDLRMPGIDGLEFLSRAKRIRPQCELVMITAHATVATAREALKRGAVDYITKPFSIDRELLPLVRGILEQLDSESGEEGEEGSGRDTGLGPLSVDGFEDVVARGAAMSALIHKARKVARSEAPVLLRGESGSGKEVLANLIHESSTRRAAPFVKINCAALPESLLESELFGYKKGAFTGATKNREGLFEAAHGGTLLLDEVGEISATFQPKLLRVLQEGEFHRIGDPGRPVRVDVRIVAATNRNLESAVEAGTFRRDLYYRLNVVPLEIPALRDHLEDLDPLIDHFVRVHGRGRSLRFDDEAMTLLRRYSWPGNIRELANAVEYALVMTEGPQAGVSELPVAIQDYCRPGVDHDAPAPHADSTLEDLEKRSIVQAMVKQDFNRTRAARLLGVTRRTLGYRIAKYQLEAELEELRGRSAEPERPRLARVRPPAPDSDWSVEGA